MINNVPILELQQAIYKLFSAVIVGYEIVDDASPLIDGEIPSPKFGVIGAITTTPRGDKATTMLWDVSVNIDLYSKYRGKKEINEMVNDVSQTLTTYQLTMASFRELTCTIEEVECRAEGWDVEVWQHGTVRAVIRLEQKRS